MAGGEEALGLHHHFCRVMVEAAMDDGNLDDDVRRGYIEAEVAQRAVDLLVLRDTEWWTADVDGQPRHTSAAAAVFTSTAPCSPRPPRRGRYKGTLRPTVALATVGSWQWEAVKAR